MNFLKTSLAILSLTLFSGCASLVVTGGGLGIGYLFTNIADKTINYPMASVNEAIVEASKRMDIQIVDRSDSENGAMIKATTKDLDISIELEIITASTTRVTVNARKNLILKDKATATAIIQQAENLLAGESGIKIARLPWRG